MKSVNRQSRFGKDAKIALLTQLACYAHEQRRTFVVVESFPSICHKAAPGIFLSGDLTQASTDCLQELLKDGLLRQDGNQLSFAHLSFQEFFAGRSLSNTPNRDAFSFAIKAYLDGDDWWRDVVVFALAQTSTPQNTVEWLETGITNEHVKNGRYAFLIGELRKVFPHIIATSLI